jgi:hypothetical protein
MWHDVLSQSTVAACISVMPAQAEVETSIKGASVGGTCNQPVLLLLLPLLGLLCCFTGRAVRVEQGPSQCCAS